MSAPGGDPFPLRSALLLVIGGGALFVALLWMIGAGLTSADANDGGGHGAGKGLNGYAGLARLIEAQGRQVMLSRSERAFDQPGLLVLTPPHWADGAELARIVESHRAFGPTLIVTPKWQAVPIPAGAGPAGAGPGWVRLGGVAAPQWQGFLDEVEVAIGPMRGRPRWQAQGLGGELPDPSRVLTGSGESLVPLVAAADGGILAAYVADGGSYPALEAMALWRPATTVAGQRRGPLVVVFEPDLIDNYGLAREANARLALALVAAMDGHGQMPVMFDLTLNGHSRSNNLLTLAFTPPFLAPTLCLLLAALTIGWRAFLRFGPPVRPQRAIAFGKRALVANSAGLIRRTRRIRLVTAPYANRARATLARALGLARQPASEDIERAIDRALATRAPDSPPFSQIAGRLRGATGEREAVIAARELHALERKLKR